MDNDISDLSKTAEPKSDRLNVDNFLGDEEKIVKITGVKKYLKDGDSHFYLNFEGDNNKPYMPCVTMERAIKEVWGKDGRVFIGRHLALAIDRTVVYGGGIVGGIRVYGMSDIENDTRVFITISNKKRKSHLIRKLVVSQKADDKSEKAVSWVESVSDEIMKLLSLEEINKFKSDKSKLIDGVSKYKKANELLNDIFTNCLAQLPDETEGDK